VLDSSDSENELDQKVSNKLMGRVIQKKLAYAHEDSLVVGKSIQQVYLQFNLMDRLNLVVLSLFSVLVVVFGLLSFLDFGSALKSSSDIVRIIYLFSQRTITQIACLNALTQIQLPPVLIFNETMVLNFVQTCPAKTIDIFTNLTKVN